MLGGLLSGLIEGDITTRTVANEGIRRSMPLAQMLAFHPHLVRENRIKLRAPSTRLTLGPGVDRVARLA